MARSVWVLETCKMRSNAETDGENSVRGVFATLKKAQQSAEKLAWPIPAGQALAWKDEAPSADDEVFHASIKSSFTTRYAITRYHVY